MHIPPASPVTEVASIEEETVIPEEIDVEEAKEEEKALCSHIRSIQKERSGRWGSILSQYVLMNNNA